MGLQVKQEEVAKLIKQKFYLSIVKKIVSSYGGTFDVNWNTGVITSDLGPKYQVQCNREIQETLEKASSEEG